MQETADGHKEAKDPCVKQRVQVHEQVLSAEHCQQLVAKLTDLVGDALGAQTDLQMSVQEPSAEQIKQTRRPLRCDPVTLPAARIRKVLAALNAKCAAASSILTLLVQCICFEYTFILLLRLLFLFLLLPPPPHLLPEEQNMLFLRR